MSFQSKNLSVIAYANGFTLWHYATTNLKADTLAQDYFVNASDMLRAGDMILINSDIEGNVASQIVSVASVSGTAVEVAPMTS